MFPSPPPFPENTKTLGRGGGGEGGNMEILARDGLNNIFRSFAKIWQLQLIALTCTLLAMNKALGMGTFQSTYSVN